MIQSDGGEKGGGGWVLTVLSESDLLRCPPDQDVDGPQHAHYCYDVKHDGAEDLSPLVLRHVELLPLEERGVTVERTMRGSLRMHGGMEPCASASRKASRGPTLRRGLSFVSMTKSNLQSSQQRVSEDLIHWLRHDWCTKLRLPVHRQGIISGHSLSPSQWQILHTHTKQTSQPMNRLFFSRRIKMR